MASVEFGGQEKRLIPGPQDWGTIFLNDVRIPKENVLRGGEEKVNSGRPWASITGRS